MQQHHDYLDPRHPLDDPLYLIVILLGMVAIAMNC